jgi:hypothetical protein
VILFEDRTAAEAAKAGIDAYACGGSCIRRHRIVDLGEG